MFKLIKNYLLGKKNVEQISNMKIFKNISFLNTLNSIEVHAFARLFHERNFKAGEIIFKENYPHTVLYLVVSGSVEIYLERPSGNLLMNTYEENGHFGEVGLFADTNRIATAVAKTDTILYAITKSDFKDFVETYPVSGVKILFNLGESLANILCNTNKRLKDYEGK